VVDARAGLIAQIANSWRVGLVSDRIQRRTRQIKKPESDRACRIERWELASGHGDNSRQPVRRTPTLVGHPPNIRDWENREGTKRREKHLPAEADGSFAAADRH